MSSHILTLSTICCLLLTFCLTAINHAFHQIRRHHAKTVTQSLGSWFFYIYIQRLLLKKQEFETLFFATICAKSVFRFLFALSYICLLFSLKDLPHITPEFDLSILYFSATEIFSIASGIILMLAVGELTPRFLASRNPLLTIRLFSPIVSVILTILFPFILILLYFAPYAFKKSLGSQNFPVEEEQVKEKIIEILQASGSSQKLHDHDERLIESVISFKDRIVREIMVPRVDIFTLPSHLSILDACAKLPKVGFSRIPVYEDNIDNIKGILLYKDLLYLYAKCHQKQDYSPLNQTIKTLLKQPLYTPETKNISNLLADFKKQKVHLAIIVDEYGGTEGLITIEDILEELVGDISDEHDHTKELFTKHKNSWEVDARMSILDIEDKLQIKIPQSGDYDTIGGYIFYCSGEIPPKGFLLHHNSFDLEVTSSNERCVEKIKITPIK